MRELREGRLRFACEDPDAPANHPKVLTVWRVEPARLLGQGPRVLPQAPARRRPDNAVRAEESPPELRPREVVWRDEAPEGKLDLLTTIDFRMTATRSSPTSCCRRPPGTRSTTSPRPTCTRSCTRSTRRSRRRGRRKTDWDAFKRIAERFSELAETPPRRPPRPGRRAAAARHARRDRPAAGRGARLARRRVRAGAREDDAEADRGRARLPARGREVGGARAAGGGARHQRQGRQLGSRRGGRRAARAATAPCAAASPTAGRRSSASSRRARRSCAVGHDATAAWRSRASARWSARTGVELADLAGPARRRPDHLRGRAGPAAHGDHLAGVVGDRGARPPLRAVHDQRRARQAVAHAVGPPALLPRPRVDARARRGAAGVPPAAASPRDLRRPGRRRRLGPARS